MKKDTKSKNKEKPFPKHDKGMFKSDATSSTINGIVINCNNDENCAVDLHSGKIKGILTNCDNGEEREVELYYKINTYKGRRSFILIGGVTGYEGFVIDDSTHPGEELFNVYLEQMKKYGWCACAGTENKWDKLFISAEEMKKALEEL